MLFANNKVCFSQAVSCSRADISFANSFCMHVFFLQEEEFVILLIP